MKSAVGNKVQAFELENARKQPHDAKSGSTGCEHEFLLILYGFTLAHNTLWPEKDFGVWWDNSHVSS